MAEVRHWLPKVIVKLWGSNKLGVAALAATFLAFTSIGAPLAIRAIATAGVILIALGVIAANAFEDYATKKGGKK